MNFQQHCVSYWKQGLEHWETAIRHLVHTLVQLWLHISVPGMKATHLDICKRVLQALLILGIPVIGFYRFYRHSRQCGQHRHSTQYRHSRCGGEYENCIYIGHDSQVSQCTLKRLICILLVYYVLDMDNVLSITLCFTLFKVDWSIHAPIFSWVLWMVCLEGVAWFSITLLLHTVGFFAISLWSLAWFLSNHKRFEVR